MSLTAALLAHLRAQRRHVLATLEGLTDAQLRTPVAPTGWAPLAAVHHLAVDVERWWFELVVQNDADAQAYFDEHPGGAWSVPQGMDVRHCYETQARRSDGIIAAADLDSLPAAWPDAFGAPQTVGEIVLHVITETATHAGHLDVVREAIDGHRHLVLD